MTQYILGNVDGLFRDYLVNSVALPQGIFELLTEEAQELWRTGQITEDTVLFHDDEFKHPPEALMPVPHPTRKIV